MNLFLYYNVYSVLQKVSCLRLLKKFSPSHFGQKVHGRGDDEVNVEQSVSLVKRGQITNQLVELPILRQIYEIIDTAGSKGLTNAEVSSLFTLQEVKVTFQMNSGFRYYLTFPCLHPVECPFKNLCHGLLLLASFFNASTQSLSMYHSFDNFT